MCFNIVCIFHLCISKQYRWRDGIWMVWHLNSCFYHIYLNWAWEQYRSNACHSLKRTSEQGLSKSLHLDKSDFGEKMSVGDVIESSPSQRGACWSSGRTCVWPCARVCARRVVSGGAGAYCGHRWVELPDSTIKVSACRKRRGTLTIISRGWIGWVGVWLPAAVALTPLPHLPFNLVALMKGLRVIHA